jgi:signal transduction histidine kinase
MLEWIRRLVSGDGFMPHGMCYLWRPDVLALHVIADALIALAYFSIPFTLLYFVRRRHDLKFQWMFVSFAVFIIACGATHVMEIVVIWHPLYWLSGGIKAVTALASVPTAILLVRLVPQALRLPSPLALEQANAALAAQVRERERAESEVRRMNEVLEARVNERTHQLEVANSELMREIAERQSIEQGLRQTQQALQLADRRKDEFIATLGHELRNPLTPIRNAVEIMAKQGALSADLSFARAVIDRQARHLTRLVDDLLEVSRITRGKLTLRREPLSMAAPIADAVEAVGSLLESRGQQLQVTLPELPLLLVGDATRITQIVLNLLNNAAKFSAPGAQIRLLLERDADAAVLRVADDGVGIAAEHLSSIFEMFSQVQPALDRSEGGLGIGLALVRGLVELHGGTVQAISEGLGRGSEFIVRLPLASAAVGATASIED